MGDAMITVFLTKMALVKKFLIVLIVFPIITAELVNKFVERSVNLETQLIKINTKIIFYVNNDFVNKSNNYIYLIDLNVEDYHIKFTDVEGETLPFTKEVIKQNDTSYSAFSVIFLTNFVKGRDVVLNVEETYVNKMVLVYKKKKFKEIDFVRYTGNVKYCSIYATKESTVAYYNKHHIVSIPPRIKTNTSSLYVFGILKPYSFKEIVFHFFLDKPLFHVLNLERVIDVSHFGRIIVTENIEIKNTGAKVHGPFKPASLDKWIYTHLPASAEEVRIYDELGAKYDWSIFEFEYYKTFKFATRYPLYGGWKTMYTLQYSLPCYEYLKRVNHYHYVLEMRVVDHVLNDVVIDNLVTKVMLPENSLYYYSYVPSLFFKQQVDESSVSSLSCFGRPTIVFTGNSIVEDHIDNFVIKYYYNLINMLRIPFKLSIFVYAIFLFIITSRRLRNLKI